MIKTKYIIGLVVILGAFSYLVWTSFSASLQYSLTPSDFIKEKEKFISQTVKISGFVEKGSIKVNGDENYFTVTDSNQSINVHYKGMLSNTFKDESEVVASGRYDESLKLFEANQVITKCSSKYESKKGE